MYKGEGEGKGKKPGCVSSIFQFGQLGVYFQDQVTSFFLLFKKGLEHIIEAISTVILGA